MTIITLPKMVRGKSVTQGYRGRWGQPAFRNIPPQKKCNT